MSLQPLAKRVLVEPLPPQEKAGDIFLPENTKNQSSGDCQQGIIIAAGSVESIKVGDRVIYGRFGGTEVTLDGKKLLIIDEDNLLGVVESDPA